jgi:predicted RNase H-like nuclease (RuvC/YqgF family)
MKIIEIIWKPKPQKTAKKAAAKATCENDNSRLDELLAEVERLKADNKGLQGEVCELLGENLLLMQKLKEMEDKK